MRETGQRGEKRVAEQSTPAEVEGVFMKTPLQKECLLGLTLPVVVIAFAGLQTLWWLAAAIMLIVRTVKTSNPASLTAQEPVGSAL